MLSIFKGCSVTTTSSSEGSRCDSLSSLGGGAIAHDPSCPSHHGSKHLLDDSDLEPPIPPVPPPPLLLHTNGGAVVVVSAAAGGGGGVGSNGNAGGGTGAVAAADYHHHHNSHHPHHHPHHLHNNTVAAAAAAGHTSSRAQLTRTWSGVSATGEDCVPLSPMGRGGEECVMQGPLRRKTVLKDGRKPPVGAWHRYWVRERSSKS